MEKLFGLEMATIAVVLSGMLLAGDCKPGTAGLAPPSIFQTGGAPDPTPPGAIHIDRPRSDAGDADHHGCLHHRRHPLALDPLGRRLRAWAKWTSWFWPAGEAPLRPISDWNAGNRWRRSWPNTRWWTISVPAINEISPGGEPHPPQQPAQHHQSWVYARRISGCFHTGEISDSAGQPLLLQALEANEVYINAAGSQGSGGRARRRIWRYTLAPTRRISSSVASPG